MARQREKTKQTPNRASAQQTRQYKKGHAKPRASIADHRPQTQAQQAFQNLANCSFRVGRLATPQHRIQNSALIVRPFIQQQTIAQAKCSTSNIIQRYNTTDDGKLVSSQKNLVLESDASKEFYASETGFKKSEEGLARAEVHNIEFSKGAEKTYDELPEKKFSKVIPTFKNITDTRVKTDTQLSREETQIKTQIPPWYDPFWIWAQLVNIGSGYQPRFYKTYLATVASNKSKVDEIGREIAKRETKNKHIGTAVDALDDLLDKINKNSDDEIEDLSPFLSLAPGVQNVIETSTREFVIANWGKQSKKAVREALRQRITRRREELAAQDNDPGTPYLPTDCGKLSQYLRGGSKAEKIVKGKNDKALKPKVGDYHYIDYNKKTDNGPWSYHYGTILFKDGADTVTLEDAAGQGTPWEKGHWYYMMYGTKGKQTFKAKTDQEYLRRLRKTPK